VMITILESSVLFLSSLRLQFHDSASVQRSSAVGLSQVSSFLYMFSALLDDHFTHDRKKLNWLGGSSAHRSAGRCHSPDGGLSMATENLSNASVDRSTLKHLLALAYIWGFGSSLMERY